MTGRQVAFKCNITIVSISYLFSCASSAPLRPSRLMVTNAFMAERSRGNPFFTCIRGREKGVQRK